MELSLTMYFMLVKIFIMKFMHDAIQKRGIFCI